MDVLLFDANLCVDSDGGIDRSLIDGRARECAIFGITPCSFEPFVLRFADTPPREAATLRELHGYGVWSGIDPKPALIGIALSIGFPSDQEISVLSIVDDGVRRGLIEGRVFLLVAVDVQIVMEEDADFLLLAVGTSDAEVPHENVADRMHVILRYDFDSQLIIAEEGISTSVSCL